MRRIYTWGLLSLLALSRVVTRSLYRQSERAVGVMHVCEKCPLSVVPVGNVNSPVDEVVVFLICSLLGIPKYAYLTARKLVTDGAVVLTPEGGLVRSRKNPKGMPSSTPRRSRVNSSSDSMHPVSAGKKGGADGVTGGLNGESKQIRGEAAEDSDDVEDDGDSEDEEDDEEEEEERKEEDEVARHVCDLIEKVRLHREQINQQQSHLQNTQQNGVANGPTSGSAGLVSTPNDR